MSKYYFLLLSALALSGCSTIDAINPFASTPKTKVSPLVKLPDGAEVKPLWKVSSGNSGPYVFTPAVSGNAVFTASADGTVQRVENGNSIWKVSLKEKISGGIGSDGERVAVGTPKGEIITLDGKSGKELWRAKAGSEVLAAPVVADGLVIARSGDSRLFAFEVGDGKRRWIYQRSSPALTLRSNVGVLVRGGKTIAGFPGGKLIALMNTNGAAVWEATVALPRGATELERVTDITSEPVILGGAVCAVAFQGKLACFDVATGTGVWTRDISSSAGLDIEGANVYVSDDKSIVYAVALSTGATVWRQDKLSERQVTRPISLGKYVVVADVQGYVHYLDSADGSIVARGSTDSSGVRSTPVRDGPGVVLQTTDGSVYRFDGLQKQ